MKFKRSNISFSISRMNTVHIYKYSILDLLYSVLNYTTLIALLYMTYTFNTFAINVMALIMVLGGVLNRKNKEITGEEALAYLEEVKQEIINKQ